MAEKSIRYLKGVGEKRAKYFEKLGITTVDGLASLLPRRYDNLGKVVDIGALRFCRGEKVSVVAQISHPIKETRIGGNNLLTTVYAEDLTGVTRIVYFNNKYIKNMLREGGTYLFYGKVSEKGEASLTNPEFYPKDAVESSKLLPVYPLVSGLSQKVVRSTVELALKEAELSDPLPAGLVSKYRLMSYRDAIFTIHKPESYEALESARRRLIFEELLYYSLGLRLLRYREKKAAAVTVDSFPTEFLDAHPVKPTQAQQRARRKQLRLLSARLHSTRSSIVLLSETVV
jgi:ATP-dependent DNA helicase RecG